VGRIWAGNITTWDDDAIKALNPVIAAKLPPVNITLGYSDNVVISVPEVFKRALVSFSPIFSDALDAAGGLFAAMPPALRGTGLSAGTSSPSRVTWLKVPSPPPPAMPWAALLQQPSPGRRAQMQ
jgi:hypothetical protein